MTLLDQKWEETEKVESGVSRDNRFLEGVISAVLKSINSTLAKASLSGSEVHPPSPKQRHALNTEDFILAKEEAGRRTETTG